MRGGIWNGSCGSVDDGSLVGIERNMGRRNEDEGLGAKA